MSEQLFLYLDNLLELQSSAADRHNHKGVLGAVREQFLVQMLMERVDNIKICTGEVTSSTGELGQHDVIVRPPGINTELGGQVRLKVESCSAIIEVKSNAKGTEITAFDNKAKLIKEENPKALCGLVCYKLRCKKKTILKRLGFIFDKDLQGYIKDDQVRSEYSSLDFILCLDEEEEDDCKKAFFVKKTTGYDLYIKPPFTKYFLMEINGIVNSANESVEV